MRPKDRKILEDLMHAPVKAEQPLAGGSTGTIRRVDFLTGPSVVLKICAGDTRALACEVRGLAELASAGTMNIPDVLYVDSERLVLAFVPTGNQSPDFFADFGRRLAKMHRQQSATFGFVENNFIGLTEQINPQVKHVAGEPRWAEYFYENRLLFQLHELERTRCVPARVHQLFSGIERCVQNLLGPVDEPPTLLHGDLWFGNFLVGPGGDPWLIDPAVYYGCRETDIALTRLFGGFSQDFYDAYQAEFPLADDFARRQPLYNLYHLMNHWVLLGGDYESQVTAELERLAV